MALYLVQHGKCLSADIDPERSLSPEGNDDVRQIAEHAKLQGIRVSLIQHSGKKRAWETAEIIASVLESGAEIQQRNGLSPLDDVIPIARKLEHSSDTMIVGHLPFMERLAAYLITGIAEKPVIKFYNGGIVCLDKHPESRGWVIAWSLVPTIK